MTPLSPPLRAGEFVLWRLDQAIHAPTWDSGEGSYRVGGRWNSRGVRAVYAALDPGTAILEVAVNKTFEALDIVAHVLTRARILDPAKIHILTAANIPNPNWLRPGMPSAGQRAFGDALLRAHPMIFIPSVVSAQSWNVIFDSSTAKNLYDSVEQEAFALDTRLNPPAA